MAATAQDNSLSVQELKKIIESLGFRATSYTRRNGVTRLYVARITRDGLYKSIAELVWEAKTHPYRLIARDETGQFYGSFPIYY